ncbi:MAG: molybdenum cofactor biosynthesis protein MoaE [Eggerthellaceae bacterium]|jgi:molybdopterin synthase catalytic subunit
MAKPEPSMDLWLEEAKKSEHADQCGMFLVHNGIVRSTAKAQVRKGEDKPPVAQVDFSYDAKGVEEAIADALTWDGIYYVKVWLNEGVLDVGQSIMYVMIGGDIRPRVVDALTKLVGHIKNDLVVEREIYVE